MKEAVIKGFTLIMLLACTAWLARAPGWDSVIAFFGALIAYLSTEVNLSRSSDHDAALFASFIEELPSDGSVMQFLSEYDLGNPFPSEPISALYQFIERWRDDEHEFLDRRLDWLRRELIRRTEQFLRRLTQHTAAHGSGLLSIGMQDFETRPEMLTLREELNNLATEVYRAHQDLVRYARGKLPA